MKTNFQSYLCLVFLFLAVNAQAQVQVSGLVKDMQTGEVLVGAHVIEQGTMNAAITNNHGYFNLVVPAGATLSISFIGYNIKSFPNKENVDTIITIFLDPGTELEEVVVKAQKTTIPNSIHLSRQKMLTLPSLGATPDILKTLQSYNGIQSLNEGSSLLLVRGGNPGENLYLLDNVPLIYVNHLGGFMSVFNPEMINNVALYKGGFLPKHGGKLSSIVDISQRDGASSALKGSYELGLTGASFSLEGPLGMNNASFIVTGRKTLTELLFLAASNLMDDNYKVTYGFHDLNAKLSWKPDEKSSVHLNLYQGDDYIRFWSKNEENSVVEKSERGNTWGNWMLSTRFNRLVSSRIFSSTSLSYTRYRLKDSYNYWMKSADEEVNSYRNFSSSVQDISLRSGWEFKPLKKWAIDFGLNSAFLIHQPNKVFDNTAATSNQAPIYSLETALYLDNIFQPLEKLKFNLGMSLVSYNSSGISDYRLEPRFRANLQIGVHHFLNLSYMDVNQYSHLIHTPQTFLNNEIWVPADQTILPASSNQYCLGWKAYFREEKYTANVDIYYKRLNNLTSYRDGFTNLLGDQNWRSKLETGGSGLSYGVEISLQKNFGTWTGNINYSFSRSTRRFNGVNQGNEYVFEYDRPHSLNLGLSYPINDKLEFTLAWVYQSGLPYTPVIGRRVSPNEYTDDRGFSKMEETLIYGERNGARMEPYHRMDVALVYHRLTKHNYKSTWTFSVYNLYNKQNPYFYYYNYRASDDMYYPEPDYYEPLGMYKVSYFPIIPSLSYKVYFGKTTRPEVTRKKEGRFRDWLYHKNN